jgi:TP53 regulating kinase-like protein
MQRIWQVEELGRQVILKHRFPKTYRLPELDAQLTASRLRQEVRIIIRARKMGIRTPALLRVGLDEGYIVMEKINGVTMKQALLTPGLLSAEERKDVLDTLGAMIAKLHDGDVVHGDLTTSNVMLVQNEQEGQGRQAFLVYLIDFGLGQFSKLSEDRAVDLYVLERSFSSAHACDGEKMFEQLMESYRSTSKNWSSTWNKLADVRSRGRKRSMVG